MVGRRPQHAVSKLASLVLCQVVSLQCVSRSSLHRLAGLSCRLLLSNDLQMVTREVHRSSLRRLMCPAYDHFIFSEIADYIYDFCPLSDVDVGLSTRLVYDVEHTYIHVWSVLQRACLASVQVSAPYFI